MCVYALHSPVAVIKLSFYARPTGTGCLEFENDGAVMMVVLHSKDFLVRCRRRLGHRALWYPHGLLGINARSVSENRHEV